MREEENDRLFFAAAILMIVGLIVYLVLKMVGIE